MEINQEATQPDWIKELILLDKQRKARSSSEATPCLQITKDLHETTNNHT